MILNKQKGEMYFLERVDSVQKYLEQVKNYERLTPEQELEYIKAYQQDGDMHARDMLVRSNQLFIFAAAKSMTTKTNDIMDLISEGNIGLLEAIDRFDTNSGNRLLSYAQAFINRNMIAYFNKNSLIYRKYDAKIGTKVRRERNIFLARNERNPTVEELQEIIKTKYGKNIEHKEAYIPFVNTSLSDICSSEGSKDFTFEDSDEFVALTSSHNEAEDTFAREHIKAKILAALNTIPEKYAKVVKMLYGIDYDREYTEEEIADIMNMTKTRVGQIRRKMIHKLKNSKYLAA